MRIFKLAGAMLAVLAFTAIGSAASASAEIVLWKWLPGAAGTHFSGKSGKAELQVKGSGTITCKESKATEKESELTSPATDATLGLAIVTFSGCKAFGLAAQSLGAASGVIIVHIEIHDCVIKLPSHFGVIIEVLPVHIDITSTGLLIDVKGSFVALVEQLSATLYDLNIEQTSGVQAIEKCEGGEALTLLSSVDSGPFTQSGETAKEGSLTFETSEEMML